LLQRKGSRQRSKLPVNKYSKNTTRQDSWWATELILEPEDNIQTENCHTALREELTKQLPLKNRKKKNYPTTWRDYNKGLA
jgi:hypothetical protein